jgi:hypothetical protein
MRLVLGGLPKLYDALYLTNRLKPTAKPCISIPKAYSHMLFQALYYDNLFSLNDIQELEKIIGEMEDDRVSLEYLEAFSNKHNDLFLHLRGYFKEYDSDIEKNGENTVLPIVPGLVNTSLLQTLTYHRKSYVIDIRDLNINLGFLKSIIQLLDNAYIVSDKLIMYSDEIIIGNVDISTLRNLSHEPYNFINKIARLEHGRYKIISNSIPEFLSETRFKPSYIYPGHVDIIEKAFTVYADDIENILYNIWTDGFITEQNLLQTLTDLFSEKFGDMTETDYASKVTIYLLLRYNLLEYVNTPAGRQYYVTIKAMRNILQRIKSRGVKSRE